MKLISRWLAVLVAAASLGVAQQANTPQASLVINGTDGPPYPIIGVLAHAGTNSLIKIHGSPYAPFLLAQSPSLVITGVPLLGGLVDIDVVNHVPEIVMDGFTVAPNEFRTGGYGFFSRPIPVASSVTPNLGVALQAAVQDAAAASGVSLTAATSVITAPGLTPISYALGDDNCLFQEASASFGFQIPFYATSYTGCWVCSNGFITFGSSSFDFTPTDAKMHDQQPRIAPFWTDLAPNDPTSGPVTLVVDRIDPDQPVMTFTFTDVPDWPVAVIGSVPHHTFGCRIDVASGDVEIHHFPGNPASFYDTMVGISAGLGLDPTGPGGFDLSALLLLPAPYPGLPDEGVYEGFRAALSVTIAFSPYHVYDLAGTYWRHSAMGAGMAGASYVVQSFVPADPNAP